MNNILSSTEEDQPQTMCRVQGSNIKTCDKGHLLHNDVLGKWFNVVICDYMGMNDLSSYQDGQTMLVNNILAHLLQNSFWTGMCACVCIIL